MKCPMETGESVEWLLAYASRKLDAGGGVELERHLEVCPACRELAAGQRAVWDALDDWEATPVSSDFDRRLGERIAGRVSWWDLATRPFRPLTAWRALPVAAAACAVFLAGLVFLERSSGPAPRSPRDGAGGSAGARPGGARAGRPGDDLPVRPLRAGG